MIACGIFGADGSLWASKPSPFPVNPASVKAIAEGFRNNGAITGGVQVGDERYIYVKGDATQVMFKKGANGVVASKANTAIIIATHDGSVKGETVLTDIGKVIDYLTKSGF